MIAAVSGTSRSTDQKVQATPMPHESHETKKIGFTVLRIPLLILLALVAVLAIGIFVYSRAS